MLAGLALYVSSMTVTSRRARRTCIAPADGPAAPRGLRPTRASSMGPPARLGRGERRDEVEGGRLAEERQIEVDEPPAPLDLHGAAPSIPRGRASQRAGRRAPSRCPKVTPAPADACARLRRRRPSSSALTTATPPAASGREERALLARHVVDAIPRRLQRARRRRSSTHGDVGLDDRRERGDLAPAGSCRSRRRRSGAAARAASSDRRDADAVVQVARASRGTRHDAGAAPRTSSFVVVLPALPVMATTRRVAAGSGASAEVRAARWLPRRRACRRPRRRRLARRSARAPARRRPATAPASIAVCEEVVPVVPLAAQRDERAPGTTARLSVVTPRATRPLGCTYHPATAHARGDRGRVESRRRWYGIGVATSTPCPPRRRDAPRALAAPRRGRRRVLHGPDDLIVLVALARDQDDVARHGSNARRARSPSAGRAPRRASSARSDRDAPRRRRPRWPADPRCAGCRS